VQNSLVFQASVFFKKFIGTSFILGSTKESKFNSDDQWWSLVDVHLAGRIVLNLWRILRHEMALTSYSFSSVVYHLLHRRCPDYSFDHLTQWFDGDNVTQRFFIY
jgi:DNA polymerase elongation subunit (family B)